MLDLITRNCNNPNDFAAGRVRSKSTVLVREFDIELLSYYRPKTTS